MAKLTTKTRGRLPAKDFALPGKRFPIEDKDHAEAAERLVGRAQKAGSISPAQAATVKDKARAKLGTTDKSGKAEAAPKWSDKKSTVLNVGGLDHDTNMKDYQHEKAAHTSKDR